MPLTYFTKPLTLNTYSFKQEHEEDIPIIQHTILQIYDEEENECLGSLPSRMRPFPTPSDVRYRMRK